MLCLYLAISAPTHTVLDEHKLWTPDRVKGCGSMVVLNESRIYEPFDRLKNRRLVLSITNPSTIPAGMTCDRGCGFAR